MRSKLWLKPLASGALTLTLAVSALASAAEDPLAAGFQQPPAAAKPRVWWHWMNGNITQEGIRRDLEWMQRVGIGGLQNFDAAWATPQRVSERLIYMTPEWKRAFAFTAETAAKLDLELSIAGSPGWSESGGPWVKPEEAMKKVVWSETRIEGGKAFTGKLLRPPSTIGPFQDIPIQRYEFQGEAHGTVRELYEDIAVIAYRLPATERTLAELKPNVTSSAGAIDGAALWDGNLAHAQSLPFGAAGQAAWVQMEFAKPQTVRAMSIVVPSAKGFVSPDYKRLGELQSSADGRAFSKVAELPAWRNNDPLQTSSFAPVTARYFRLVLDTPPPPFTMPGLELLIKPKTEHRLAEFVLHSSARVNLAEHKAAFFVQANLEQAPTSQTSKDSAVDKTAVIDLTSRMRPDGSLDWQAPAGKWAVMRFGYSLLGVTNHPASPEGTGLEVDKLNRKHVLSNYTQYLDQFAKILGPELMGKQGLRGMINDSWEAGAQNWTEALPQEFAKRRGYKIHPWLPALAGRVIDSAEATERFLWDFRTTLAELVVDEHYRAITEELHKRGMIHYAESHEGSRALIADGMAAKRFADVPMSAMWTESGFSSQSVYDADIRESASVAHFYGQNLVAAESLTAIGNTYAFTPALLKPTADRELAHGLNRFVIHTSAHQPLEDPGPGFTLGPFGQWFTRKETWAEQAGAWVSYLARSSYLLQQGRFVADVLYFYGEDSNITVLYEDAPPVPEGFNFDYANTQVLNDVKVENGQLVAPSGMRYRVLALDPRTRVMSLPVLKRIRELVSAGAIVVGAKPESTPSLADDAAEFRAASDAVWNQTARVHQLSLQAALGKLGIEPDFSYVKPAADSEVLFVHRELNDGHVYFVNNRQPREERIEASFRVRGKAPQLWYADTGRMEPASYRIVNGRTIVPLNLAPADAVFVVFRDDTTQTARSLPTRQRNTLHDFDGAWELRFPAGQAAPATTRLDRLESWTRNVDAGIKYFSGTASYLRTLRVPAAWLKNQRVELDLGAVKDLAEVLVNGKSVGVLWKPPFRIDVTDALRRGDNQIEIKVTNTWVNRLIGDKQPGAKQYAYATFDPYKADSPLLESGLLGPVRLVAVK